MRRGIDGLAGLIENQFELNLFEEDVIFLFCGRRRDRFKVLHWDRDGFTLLYKRIEDGNLQWPKDQGEVKQLSGQQLKKADETIDELRLEITRMNELMTIMVKRQFGSKSDKVHPNQTSFFDDEDDDMPDGPIVTVPLEKKPASKKSTPRKAKTQSIENLPVEEHVTYLTEEQCICEFCDETMSSRFKKCIRESVKFIPAQLIRVREIVETALCRCQESAHNLTNMVQAKAITYARNQRQYLREFLNGGRLVASNNSAERNIKPIALGRKNHMFSGSLKGANANAIVYTLIETAKTHKVDPYKYLEYLFTHLPDLESCVENIHDTQLRATRKKALLEEFLPWAKTIQHSCAIAQ